MSALGRFVHQLVESEARVGHIRTHGERPLECACRVAQPIERAEREAELVMGLGELRIELGCSGDMLMGRARLSLSAESHAQSEMAGSAARVESDRAPARDNRFVEAPEFG